MNKVTHVMELWAAGYVDNSVIVCEAMYSL